MSRHYPCGEPAEWRPIAEPVCREMRRSRRKQFLLRWFGALMLVLFFAGISWMVQRVTLP